MRLTVAHRIGYCPGVKAAVALAYGAIGKNAVCLGDVIHDEAVVADLAARGVPTVSSLEELDASGATTVVVRSHGIGDDVRAQLVRRGLTILDGTCPFVEKIHSIVRDRYGAGYHIVIIGTKGHPEVTGIDGCCEGTATIVGCAEDCAAVPRDKDLCLVAQTTFQRAEYDKIVKIIDNLAVKTLEIFETICYTTLERQAEIDRMSAVCDKMLILGGSDSNNTEQLRQISLRRCRDSYLIRDVKQLQSIVFCKQDHVGVASGASTRKELIQEVLRFMSENNEVQPVEEADEKLETAVTPESAETPVEPVTAEEAVAEEAPAEPVTEEQPAEAPAEEQPAAPAESAEAPAPAADTFGAMFEEQTNGPVVRVGAKIDHAIVISANADGVQVNIGAKYDAFIPADEAVFEGEEYNPANFPADLEIGVIVTSAPANTRSDDRLFGASKRKYDAIKKGNELVNGIRNGEVFELKITKVVEKGLIGHLGNYRVFVPQSQVEERFVKKLDPYLGRTLRLRAIEIDDVKCKIVATQKEVLKEEREAKEHEFFDNIYVDAVVIGKVMRTTKFGAFVNVGGFDCLAHIIDLSWTKIDSVDDVLTIGQEYEFVVLKIDRVNKRVSLGYKQLHPHPFNEFVTKYGVGDVVEGTVVRLKEFGAFVKVAEGVDGLVHISEASHSFVKNINDVLKVGDVVKAMITKIDVENRKISLSIKAATEPPELSEDFDPSESKPSRKDRPARGERKPRTEKPADEQSNWSESASNNPFADLLKDVKPGDEE